LVEIAKLKTDVQLARRKLNAFLQREPKARQDLPRQKEELLRITQSTIERYGKAIALWETRRSDVESSETAVSKQIDRLNRKEAVDMGDLERERNAVQKLSEETAANLRKIREEVDRVVAEERELDCATKRANVEQLKLEIENLKRQKEDFGNRQATQKKINAIESVAVFMGGSIDHLEEEFATLNEYGVKLRRQKRRIKDAIDASIGGLALYGVNPPRYRPLPGR
jgi:predicted  nucleic acid-binding Zn-ribbon protein